MAKIDANDNNILYINGQKFDLRLLDKLKGQKVNNSIWAQYDSTDKYGNRNSIFDINEIQAIKDDLLTMAKNGVVDENALSIIFENKVNMTELKKNISIMQLKHDAKHNNIQTEIACQPVSTKIPSNEIKRVNLQTSSDEPEVTETSTEKPEERDGRTAYIDEFKDYVPTDLKKFNKIWRFASHCTDKERAKHITKMVCALTENYGIDAEVIIPMLKRETGGFVFDKRTMDPENKKYKGVMQVGPEAIISMYANPDDVNNPKLSKKEKAYAGEHTRFSADEQRIQELKEKYKTAEELYEAIKTDVALGLEVGIMTYKSKLSYSKGNTREALKLYCGDQYSIPKEMNIPDKIWPIPEYKSK